MAKLLDFRHRPRRRKARRPIRRRYGYTDLSGQLRSSLDKFTGVKVIPFALVAMMIVGYILLIGPGDYFLLKKVFRRMEWTWFTFPDHRHRRQPHGLLARVLSQGQSTARESGRSGRCGCCVAAHPRHDVAEHFQPADGIVRSFASAARRRAATAAEERLGLFCLVRLARRRAGRHESARRQRFALVAVVSFMARLRASCRPRRIRSKACRSKSGPPRVSPAAGRPMPKSCPAPILSEEDQRPDRLDHESLRFSAGKLHRRPRPLGV